MTALLISANVGKRALVVSAEMSSDLLVGPAENTFEQYECIEDSLRREVPAGALLYVAEDDELWDQRLIELSSPDLVVVDEEKKATHIIAVDQVGDQPSCAGLRLRVSPR